MKLKYLIFGLATFFLVSCEEFMEPDSPSTFNDEYIFSNVDDARKAVNSIYVQFSHDGFRSRLSNNMTANTDIAHSSGWPSSGDRYQLWDLRPQLNNGDLRYVWEIGYKAIRDANIAIEGLQKSKAFNSSDAATANMMKQLLGEAYTLRAYWYSMLTFYFGDVPFITEAPKAGVDFNKPRMDRNEILTAVINDLIEIEDDMMWAEQLPYGIEQVNREYTLGMIARLSLQRGGYYLTPDMQMVRPNDYLEYYQLAKDYSLKLITLKDRPLPDDYRQVFMNQNKFVSPVNSDVLFEVPFAIGEGDVGWNIGIRVNGGVDALHNYGSGSNYLNMTPTYYYSFDPQDERRDVVNNLYYIDKDNKTYLVDVNDISQGKWSRHFLDTPPGKATAKGTGINWPMMRYADVLLMFAEAENELNGPTAAAQAAFKRVRQRAFPEAESAAKVEQYVADVSSSQGEFFEAIVDERAWELGGEMIRRYDLIRWNLYAERVAETVEGLKEMAENAFLTVETGNTEGQLPPYLWVRRDASGNLEILNRDYAVLAAPDESWERRDWLINLYDEDGTPYQYAEWIVRDWANYTAPVRYIFPIPAVGIDNSQGVLKNDGYGYNF